MSLTLKSKTNSTNIDEYFDFIYLQYYKKIRKYILNSVKNEDAADDISSQVFLIFYKYLTDSREITNTENWLYKVAKDKIVDYIRKKPNNEIPLSFEVINDILIHEDKPLGIFMQLEGHLPEKDLEDLKLHFMYGYTFKEIADYRKKSAASYKMKFSRLYEKIRELKIFSLFFIFFVTFCALETYYLIGGLK